MKVRLTPSYIAGAVLVILLLVSVLITIGIWLRLWGTVEFYAMVHSFILNWVVVITFAILGGILFGMFFGFKLLSSQGFTPFEKSMLEMFAKVEEVNKRVKRIEEVLETIEKSGSTKPESQGEIKKEVAGKE